MYQISKSFHFSASHQLNGLEKDHPCSRLHGHNYVVTIVLRSEGLDPNGFVLDYGELKPIKDFIDNSLDHRHLNKVMVFNPTAENIARMIYQKFIGQFKSLYAVKVKETDKTEAIYYAE